MRMLAGSFARPGARSKGESPCGQPEPHAWTCRTTQRPHRAHRYHAGPRTYRTGHTGLPQVCDREREMAMAHPSLMESDAPC